MVYEIPFFLPHIGPEEQEAVARVLASGWLTTGKEALAFEREFAQASSMTHALAVNSATSGLHLAYKTLRRGERARLFCPTMTFTASAEIARYHEDPITLLDCEEGSYHLDPEALDSALDRWERQKMSSGERRAIVMSVAFSGCDHRFGEISEICKNHGALLIEDGAHCAPAREKGRWLGSGGHAGVYSFYANKTLVTGEGGMVVTEDEELARAMKVERNHGIDRDVWDRYTKKTGLGGYDIIAAGHKYNMPDTAAAMGRVQLSKVESMHRSRARLAARYNRVLASIPGVHLPYKHHIASDPEGWQSHSWHLYVVQLEPRQRDRVRRILRERGISTSHHYTPLHRFSYYKGLGLGDDKDFPVATALADSSVSLPIYPAMTEDQVDQVGEQLAQAIGVGIHGN